MSVVIVGGHDRMHVRYKEICRKYGCKCKVFTQMPCNFVNQIGNPDIIVLFTNTVAHKMVGIAVSQAKKTGAYVARSHSSSEYALNEILKNYKESA